MDSPIDRSADPNIDTLAVLLESVSDAARALTAGQMADELSTSTKPSKRSLGSPLIVDSSRDRLPNPEYSFALSSCRRRGFRLIPKVGGLIGLALAVAVPANSTFESPVSDLWRRLVDLGGEIASPHLGSMGWRKLGGPAVPRLTVQSSRAMSGEPAPLGLALQGESDGAVVLLTGLVPGMELSIGRKVAGDAWEVLATELDGAWIGPPKTFVGPVELIAELRLSPDKIADRQAVHIDWIPAIAPTAIRHQLDERSITEAPTISPPSSKRQADPKEITAEPQISLPRESETEIIASAPSSPTLSQSELNQEAIKAVPLDSLTSTQSQLVPDEVKALRPILPTATQNHFYPEEIATASPSLTRSLAPSQLGQEEFGAVAMISPTHAQKELDEDIAAQRMPTQKQLDQEEIVAQPPSLAAALPNKLIMADSQPSPMPAQYQPDRGEIATAPTISSTSPRQLDQEQITGRAPISSPPDGHSLDHEQIAVLLRRGKDLIASGDIAAARLVLQRAADANDAQAALALGATYDPLVLRELKVYGPAADPAMARSWYEKARAFGSETATRRIEMLTTVVR
jgi:hypothetical protein